MGEGPNKEQKIFRDQLSMFTLFSVMLANSANFINEIADFLRVLCVDKSYYILSIRRYIFA